MSADNNLKRDAADRCPRDLSSLQRLTLALARAVDSDEIVRVLFEELPTIINADGIGVVRTRPPHVWVWSQPWRNEQAETLRFRLLERLGRSSMGQPDQVRGSHAPRYRVRDRHLFLVPKTSACLLDQDDRAPGSHESRMTRGAAIEGILRIEREAEHPFTERETHLLDTIAAVAGLAMGRASAHRQVRESQVRDSLTDVLSRGALNGLLHRELNAGYRYRVPSCLLLLDLDYFTTVNNQLGHVAGDCILRSVASLVEENVREVDSVSRYGGETFAVVLPHTGLGQAQALAERIREAVERRAFEVANGHARMTTSIGLADCHHAKGESVAEWMAAAESALYEAKARGRNCVVTHAPSPHIPAQAALSLVA